MKYLMLTLISFSVWAKADLTTIAEKSQWMKTGRADEVERLCRDFASTYPDKVTCNIYGVTPLGRNMHYLVVGEKLGSAPVLWIQAGIHSGEIDGKDATFWLLREILSGQVKSNPLKGLTLVFIPIVSLDAHERFGKWNRPNQIGPEEMGWRVNSKNLNLNRDFGKLEISELQDLVKLWLKVDPILSADLHVTDGADFQAEVGLVTAPTSHYGQTPLHLAGSVLEKELIEKLKSKGRKALEFYPDFEDALNPKSGFGRYISPIRYSHAYWSEQGRLGLLVESHSWKDYKTRVRTHHDVVLSLMELMQKNGQEWEKLKNHKEDFVNKDVILEQKHTLKSREIEFEGYKYEVYTSNVSGGKVIKFFPDQKETWKLPFYETFYPTLKVKAPAVGYIIPPAEAEWFKNKLKMHGIVVENYEGQPLQDVFVFKASEKTFAPAPYEGLHNLTVKGEWRNAKEEIPKGSLLVPINQPRARLVMLLLEPMSRDSFLSWGFLNRYFEQKEYMENYVMELVALEMLKDPKIKAEFEQKLKNDKKFADSPEERWSFFYRKHPSWDQKMDVYPIYKL
ncbi:MAG: hypothetical protein K2P81_03190 [Bacteriovoracaceae bacterium]|nr:hypothetical protein [Bacteriovoracaceae bacterium]